jgi:hypothetical protein
MKTADIAVLGICILVSACQRATPDDILSGTQQEDSTFLPGDSLTYEVITTDTVGWFGIWMQGDGTTAVNTLNSVTYGSPNYLPSGWRYTFAAPAPPFQAFISVDASTFADDITVNLYKNGTLLKSVTNDVGKGFAKLLVDANNDSLTGTPAAPVLTYEVLVTDRDSSKFQSDSWIGHWVNMHGIYNDLDNPYHQDDRLSTFFAIPSGWRYTFKPDHLPFAMRMQAAPYTQGGGTVTVNLFVNGKLVRSQSTSQNVMYPPVEYTVQ